MQNSWEKSSKYMKPRREDVFYELWLLEWWLLVDGSVIDFFLVCFFFYPKLFTKILHYIINIL